MSLVIALKSARKYISSGKCIEIVAGQRYKKSSKTYKAFSPTYFGPISLDRNPNLTYEQALALVKYYITLAEQEDVITAFCRDYPNFNPSGVECQVRIIAGRDNTRDDKGLDNPSKALENAMLVTDANRFSTSTSPKIDEFLV